MAKYVLFDVETTGNQEEDRIIQIGAMVVDSKGNVEVFNELCSADLPIKIEAMVIHGIVPEMIENKPKFIETNFYKTLQTLNNLDNYLIAHNISFDLGMLKKEGFVPNMRIIDTLQVSKHLIKEDHSKALQYLRYKLELYKSEQSEAEKYNMNVKAHDALSDVLVMKLLLSKLVILAKEQFEGINPISKMEELTNKPVLINIFPFGKYKGQKIGDIFLSDRGYIQWMMDSVDLDNDMRYTFEYLSQSLD